MINKKKRNENVLKKFIIFFVHFSLSSNRMEEQKNVSEELMDKIITFINTDRIKNTSSVYGGFGGGITGYKGAGCLMKYLSRDDQERIHSARGYKQVNKSAIQDKDERILITLNGLYRTALQKAPQVIASVPKTEFLILDSLTSETIT